MPKPFAFGILILLCSQCASAQKTGDTALDGNTANIINRYYSKSLAEQSPLYNGKEYIDYTFNLQEGHPFFGGPAFVKGDIYFDGMIFHNTPILYDLIKDQVIVPDFQNVYKVNLPADKIEYFTLNDHIFIRLVNSQANGISTGFYEQLYKGKVGLYAKRKKEIIERSGYQRIDRSVIIGNSYYIMKEGIYYHFKNKRGLLSILKDKKKEIKQYLNKNRVVYKVSPEQAMLRIVEYYNQLIN